MASRTTTKAASRSRKPAKRAAGAKRTSAARARKAATRTLAKSRALAVKPSKSPIKPKPPKSFTFSKKLERAKERPGKAATSDNAKAAPKGTSTKSRKLSGKGAEPVETLESVKPDKDGYVLFKGRRVRVISTKNVKKRRPRSAAARAEREREQQAQSEADKPIVTKLNTKELDHYRDLLLLLRSQKLGDLSAKEAEALQGNGGNLSHMPIHMADIGTDAYEQDFTLGLAESDRKLIREIDEALARIESKTYGMCLLTGKPIPKSRLNAKPWAKYTIEAARMIENGQVA